MKWKEVHSTYESNLEKLKKLSPYELIGVQKGIPFSQIKEEYLKKIKIYHPDRTDKFLQEYSQEVTKLLNDAFEKIRDELNAK